MKLDFDGLEKEDILVAVSPSKGRVKFIFGIFLVILILALVVLSLWPAMPQPHRYVPQEAQIAARKIELLERGFGSQQTFSEAELNSFLAALKGGALPARLSLQIYPDAVMVNMVKTTGKIELFGKKFGPFTLTKRLILVLDKGVGRLKLSGGNFGHLPLPGVAAKVLVPSFNEAIEAGWRNVKMLDRIFIVRMGDKTIVVAAKNQAN
jgi:hypothetical protein